MPDPSPFGAPAAAPSAPPPAAYFPPPPADAPTLYAWMGGAPALDRLMATFYARVPEDPVLAPVFLHMAPAHAAHVAAFVGEVLGGPPTYSADVAEPENPEGGHGSGLGSGHARMIGRHLGRGLTERQRARWVALLLESADAVGLPDDPEFRSAFVAYLEWGSRLAVVNSQPGVPAPEHLPMPLWGWGVPGGPYRPAQ